MAHIQLTEHAIDRYIHRVHPDLSRAQAFERLGAGLLVAVRGAKKTKYGQLVYQLPDCVLIVKEARAEGKLIAVTVYPLSQSVSTWDTLLAEQMREFEARQQAPDSPPQAMDPPPRTLIAAACPILPNPPVAPLKLPPEPVQDVEEFLVRLKEEDRTSKQLRHRLTEVEGQLRRSDQREERRREELEKLETCLRRLYAEFGEGDTFRQILQAEGCGWVIAKDQAQRPPAPSSVGLGRSDCSDQAGCLCGGQDAVSTISSPKSEKEYHISDAHFIRPKGSDIGVYTFGELIAGARGKPGSV